MIGHLLCACMCFHLMQFFVYVIVCLSIIIYFKYYCYWESVSHGTSNPVRALAIWLSPIMLLNQTGFPISSCFQSIHLLLYMNKVTNALAMFKQHDITDEYFKTIVI